MSDTYVEDFVRNWGRLEYQASIFENSLPSHLIEVVSAAAIAELFTVVEARKTQTLGMYRFSDLSEFLPIWEAEESEHGRVLARLVNLDEAYSKTLISFSLFEKCRNWVVTKSLPIARYLPGMDFVLCATGVIAEQLTILLYNEIAKQVAIDEHRELFHALARQEGRHLRFYKAVCKDRVSRQNALSRTCSRVLMRLFWLPVGVDCLGESGWHKCFDPILMDQDLLLRLRASDDLLDEFAPTAGLHLMNRFLDQRHS
jgi:rubrerythrin